jgi:putative transposase
MCIRNLAHDPQGLKLRVGMVLLRREGWLVNRKRVRATMQRDMLSTPAPIPTGPTERRSIDFVHNTLADGRPFRVLTVVDN